MKDSPVRIKADLFSKILICSKVSHFKDDVSAQCLRCHDAIFIRPYSAGVTVKMCGPCGMETLKHEPSSHVGVLPKAAAEFLEFMRKIS